MIPIPPLLAALLLLPAAQDPPKKEKPKLTLTGSFVFGGRSHESHPSPVRLIIKNPLKDQFDAVVRLRWGPPQLQQPKIVTWSSFVEDEDSPIYELATVLPKFSQRLHTVTVEPVHAQYNSLWAFLIVDDETKYSFEIRGQAVNRNATCIAVVGATVAFGRPPDPDLLFERVQVRPQHLPDHWYGITFADRLIWMDADPSKLQDPEALRLWVAAGGHLIVARHLRDGIIGSVLEPMIPVVLKENGNVTDLSLGETVIVGSVPIMEVEPRPGAEVVMTHDSKPIQVEGRYGRGRVTFLAFSPKTAAVRDNAGTPRFWNALLEIHAADEIQEEEFSFEEDDVDRAVGSPEIVKWVTTFSDMPPPSMNWAFTLILVYVLLVGPVDYLVLRQLNRMHWTWFTFVSYVVAFSAAALLAGARLASHPSAVRELAVLDFMPEAQVSRGWCVAAVLSPVKDSFSIDTEGSGGALRTVDQDLFKSTYGWEGFGGIVRPLTVRLGERMTVNRWDFPHGGQRFGIREWCEAGPPAVSAVVGGTPGGAVTLDVHNALGRTLEQAVLYTADGVYVIGSVAPGSKSFSLDAPTHDGWDEFIAPLAYRDQALNWIPIATPPVRRFELDPPGLMKAMDSSDWVRGDRAMLVGLVREGKYFLFDARNPAHSSTAVVRVYIRFPP